MNALTRTGAETPLAVDPDETPVEIILPVPRPTTPDTDDVAEPYMVIDDAELDRKAWRTMRQHEAVESMRRTYPDAEEAADGRAVWVPRSAAWGAVPYPCRLADGDVVMLRTDRTVFRVGCWVDLEHPAMVGEQPSTDDDSEIPF